MGLFSWNCKCCGHPLLSPSAATEGNGWMTKGVVLEKNREILHGEYDGYGRLDDQEFAIYFESESPECYHKSCWVKAGKPTEFTEGSERSPDQGWFFDDGVHNIPDPLKVS